MIRKYFGADQLKNANVAVFFWKRARLVDPWPVVGPSQHRTNIPFAVTDPILSQEQHGTLGFDLNRPVFPYTACGHDLLGTAQTFRLQ
ncbi:hypothetical protein QR680_010688 [Steinernema hermaphroditum]|uniref:Uncharacterized protein n=1 Tax=Steinernema hermaphroditum TaxID=289476 RepID=A0AA39IR78_9BILA|nr:hypothetical protein QR680_010688 [Steinernema hermaphroditum]